MTRRTVAQYETGPDGKPVWSTRRDVPVDQWEGDWSGTAPVDMTGRAIRPGDWLVKTFQSGRASNMEVRQVREVRVVTRRLAKWETEADLNPTPRVFLDDSRVPVEYPGRCLVIDWDPEAGRVRPAGPDAGEPDRGA